MQAFLDRFSATLLKRVHAAVLLDGAGWHIAGHLAVPDNVSLIFLPPYAPELSPVERVWLYLAPPLPRSRRHRRRLLPSLEPTHRRARPHRLPHQLPLPAVSQDFMSRV
jgi:transposase